MVLSHTSLFPWPRPGGCKLCFRAIKRGIFRSISTGDQSLSRVPPDRTEGHLCPVAGTQRALPASPSRQLPPMVQSVVGTATRSHSSPALLYKTWVLEILKHLKQRSIVPVYILKTRSYTCAFNLYHHNHPSHR